MPDEPPYAFLLPWRSQRLTFAYGIDQWRAIQRELDVGPWVLEARLAARACTEREVSVALVQGLAGAGLALRDAERLVEENLTGNGRLEEARLVARAAVNRALYAIDGDLAGESSAPGKGTTKAPTPRRERSRSPGS